MVTKARERYRQELRRTILDAARDAFAEHGYEGVSMRSLAERVGCSHAGLYLHFKDKNDLFDALVEESFARLADGLRKLTESQRKSDPAVLLKKAARAYVDFGLKNPAAYEFAFVLRRPGGAPSKPHALYVQVRSLIKRCIDEKKFRRMDVDAASQAIWAAIHGVTSLLITRPSFPWKDRDALIRRVIDSAVDGLRPEKKKTR